MVDFIVGGAIAVAFAAIVVNGIRKFKRGDSGCGCGCSGCSSGCRHKDP